MKRPLVLVGLVLLGLVACVPNIQNIAIHELLLYGPNERHVFFYGDAAPDASQTIKLNNQELKLSAQAATGPLSVPGALSVAGQATLPLALRGLGERFALATIPFSNELSLLTRSPLEAVVYFDGRAWWSLGGPFNADQKRRVQPSNRPQGLRGLGQLSDAEADALAAHLRPRGPLALALLAPELINETPLQLEPRPLTYRRTALALQEGVPLDVLGGFANTPDLEHKLLGQSNNSAYGSNQPSLRFERNQSAFVRTWQLAHGNELPVPNAPTLDFNRYRAVTFFWGQKPSGGYGMTLAGVKLEDKTLVLLFNLRQPAPNALTAQVISSPVVMLQVATNATSAKAVDATTGKTLAETLLGQ